MFGIGGGELVIILIIVFIFIGPDKFPEIAKSFGKSMKTFKETGHEIKKTIYEEVNKSDLDNITIITDLQKDFKKAKEGINPIGDIKKIVKDMNPIDDIKSTINDMNPVDNIKKEVKQIKKDIDIS